MRDLKNGTDYRRVGLGYTHHTAIQIDNKGYEDSLKKGPQKSTNVDTPCQRLEEVSISSLRIKSNIKLCQNTSMVSSNTSMYLQHL